MMFTVCFTMSTGGCGFGYGYRRNSWQPRSWLYGVKKESGDNVDIVIEGSPVLHHVGDLSRACCCYMVGLHLKYPKSLRYSFEMFQKMLLEVDAGNFSAIVQRHKNIVVS